MSVNCRKRSENNDIYKYTSTCFKLYCNYVTISSCNSFLILTLNCLHFEAESEVKTMQKTVMTDYARKLQKLYYNNVSLSNVSTLTKLYNVFVDSATTANEKQVAHNKLKALCKKYKVDLQNFIYNCDFDLQFETRRKQKEAEAEALRKEAEAKEVKLTVKKRSRRSLIIDMLFDNIFDVDSINEVLSEVYNYEDLKANKKAIAGTRYDLTVNKDCFFQNCTDSRIIAFNADKQSYYKHAYVV